MSGLGTDRKFYRDSGQIFVFGSNLAGIHGAGAALFARRSLGALQCLGEGIMGQSYALPTKGVHLETLPLDAIAMHAERFKIAARCRHDLVFFVTRVGCGLAGYRDEQIAPLLARAPMNCVLPLGWRALNGENEDDNPGQKLAKDPEKREAESPKSL